MITDINIMQPALQNTMAFVHLHTMGDLLMLCDFDNKQLLTEISKWDLDWKRYNPRKINNNRWGLSITSIDGQLSGVPDLDSLSQYNAENGTSFDNRNIRTLTPVFDNSPTLQSILKPFIPWLTRCHFLKLNAGGFFPEHYDTNKVIPGYFETRLVAFVNNCNKHTLKFLVEDKLLDVRNGELYWINTSKRHSVFSTTDDCIMIVICLDFNPELLNVIVDNYKVK